MTDDLLVYGSYGYTGALIARTAVDQGLSPVLAGRRAEPLERQAIDLDCDHRVFSLEHPGVARQQIAGVDVVLNCAGPFAGTAAPLIAACLGTGTDYLDIAGEIDVLEAIAGRDRDAEQADVALLPGVGFDVVPTDCLAASLETQLPSATHLTLALDDPGTFSPGTLQSIVGDLPRSGAVRANGEIKSVPAAWRTRRFDFGEGPKQAVTVPWGDVATAYYATGIPNIEVYATVPEFAVALMRGMRPLSSLLALGPVQTVLQRAIDLTVSGPAPDERARSVARIWGEVIDEEGDRAAARLRTPDPYELTARTATEAARRALAGEVAPGFQTPASAFGPAFAMEFDGVERENVPTEEPTVTADADAGSQD